MAATEISKGGRDVFKKQMEASAIQKELERIQREEAHCQGVGLGQEGWLSSTVQICAGAPATQMLEHINSWHSSS